MRRRVAVARTTGVSRTIVGSRPSVTVTPLATAKTRANSRRGLSREPRAITSPSAPNSPSRRHPSASSSSAARNPIVGARWPTASPARSVFSAPTATSPEAATIATTASGSHGGRATATAGVAASPASDRASVRPAGTAIASDRLRPAGARRAPAGVCQPSAIGPDRAPDIAVRERVIGLPLLQLLDAGRPKEPGLDEVGGPFSRLRDTDFAHDLDDREQRAAQSVEVPVRVGRAQVLPEDLRA